MFQASRRRTIRCCYACLVLLLITSGCVKAQLTSDSSSEKNQTNRGETPAVNKPDRTFLAPVEACQFLERSHRSYDMVQEIVSYALDLESSEYWPQRCQHEMQAKPSWKPPYC